MSFITKDVLLSSLETLVKGGFNTIETSSLVYFIALCKILKTTNETSVSLDSGVQEREGFVRNVSELIEINDDYIWHPIGSLDDVTSWNKGKSIGLFVSSNLFTTSYNRKEDNYPKRLPLLSFSDGEASLHSDYQKNLNTIFSKYSNEVLQATCIWILRNHNFREEIVSTDTLIDIINEVYGFDINIDSEVSKSEIDVSANQPTSLIVLLELANEKVRQNRAINSTKHYDSIQTKLSKPFLLLAGISGTGKTRFVREQAKLTGSLSENYCLTSVRPDWHEPSDILGYISRLGNNGAEYVTTEVLQFIAKAWRAIIDAKLEIQADNDNHLTVTGNKDQLKAILPYWLCLDEMNLAPVEQYFADYLSISETREWQWRDDDSFDYCCDALLSSATIKQLDDNAKNQLRKKLDFHDEDYNDAWDLFCKHGLSLPFNLIVAGTVNMDETTHGFSHKVIDRALSFDFGEFFPNDFDHFFESSAKPKALSYPIHSHATKAYLSAFDKDGARSIHFLKTINQVLDNTPFKLAFRALNELLLAVISSEPTDERELQAVWDDFLMHKVLPRIEGDYDKLAVIHKLDNSNEHSLLTELARVLEQELADIWPNQNSPDRPRPDLYRETSDGSTLCVVCRSETKLAWMQERLQRSGFTSFWP